jgi:hypothetical protein
MKIVTAVWTVAAVLPHDRPNMTEAVEANWIKQEEKDKSPHGSTGDNLAMRTEYQL